MKVRSFCRATVFVAFLFAPASHAQVTPLESPGAESRLDGREVDLGSVASQPVLKTESLRQHEPSAERFHKTQFLALSGAVYAASMADMHETRHNRNYSWWYEKDPLARPFVRLPAPAYYAAGLTLATGINWVSWKMGHSRRWHKLAPLPQLFSIAGNTYGFKSNVSTSH